MARDSGKRREEKAAYRIAAHTALELHDPVLVELAFMGFGRVRMEMGEERVHEKLLELLPDKKAYIVLRDAIRRGVLRTVVEQSESD